MQLKHAPIELIFIMTHQPRGCRFGKNTAKSNECPEATFNYSLPTDARLFDDDLDGSKAYAEALKKTGYITAEECANICTGLELVRYDWIEGLIKLLPSNENVFAVNDRRFNELVGEVSQRLHTCRSRNEQVTTDMKLWLRKAIRETCCSLRKLMESILQQSKQHLGVSMASYAHLQKAQIVQFSHWLLSDAFAFREDCLRLCDVRSRSNVLPLGNGALSGSPLQIDCVWLAERLGFAAVSGNSMHALGDGDFVSELFFK